MSSFKSKIKLLAGLLAGNTAYSPPLSVQLDPTNQCNFRCLNCRFHSPALTGPKPRPGSLDFDVIRRLAEELHPHQTRSIALVGSGEPLLYPNIVETLELFKRQGFEITLYTNGSLLDFKLSGDLLRVGLDKLYVSLWASSPDQYAVNYPGASLDNYQLVLENMKRIAEMKKARQVSRPLIFWQHPINRNNCSSLETLIAEVTKVGCDGVSFAPLNTPRGMHRGSALTRHSLNTLKADLRGLSSRLDSSGLQHNIPDTLRRYELREATPVNCCYAAWVRARVHTDGAVSSCRCQNTPFGNLHEKSFRELWNGPEIRNFRQAARTRAGLFSLISHYDCDNCCFSTTNRKIHHYHRLLSC